MVARSLRKRFSNLARRESTSSTQSSSSAKSTTTGKQFNPKNSDDSTITKPRVVFLENANQTYTVCRIYDSDKDKDQVWYTRQDIENIKRRNKLMVELQQRGDLVESEELTFEGLEHNLLRKELEHLQYEVKDAVLDEQESLGKDKSNDIAERIAKVYRKAIRDYSKQKEAIERCVRDPT